MESLRQTRVHPPIYFRIVFHELISLWKIVLPSLSTATVVNAVYTIVTLSHFSENRVIQYIHSQTYNVQGGIGYASAMAFIYFGLMTILLAIVYLFLMQRAKRS